MDRDHIARIAGKVKAATLHLHYQASPNPQWVMRHLCEALRELAPLLKQAAVQEMEDEVRECWPRDPEEMRQDAEDMQQAQREASRG